MEKKAQTFDSSFGAYLRRIGKLPISEIWLPLKAACFLAFFEALLWVVIIYILHTGQKVLGIPNSYLTGAIGIIIVLSLIRNRRTFMVHIKMVCRDVASLPTWMRWWFIIVPFSAMGLSCYISRRLGIAEFFLWLAAIYLFAQLDNRSAAYLVAQPTAAQMLVSRSEEHFWVEWFPKGDYERHLQELMDIGRVFTPPDYDYSEQADRFERALSGIVFTIVQNAEEHGRI